MDDEAQRRGVWAERSPGGLVLSGGREGDDAQVVLRVGDPITAQTLDALVSVLRHGKDPMTSYEDELAGRGRTMSRTCGPCARETIHVSGWGAHPGGDEFFPASAEAFDGDFSGLPTPEDWDDWRPVPVFVQGSPVRRAPGVWLVRVQAKTTARRPEIAGKVFFAFVRVTAETSPWECGEEVRKRRAMVTGRHGGPAEPVERAFAEFLFDHLGAALADETGRLVAFVSHDHTRSVRL